MNNRFCRPARKIYRSWAVFLFGLVLAGAVERQIALCQAQEESALAKPLVLHREDVVIFTGGANTVAAQENAHLETLLTLGCSSGAAQFRSMAWEGDTVFEQRREMNFGSWPDQLRRVGATVIFAQFGQMEALQARTSVPQFIYAYEKLLNQFSTQTPRIILLSPTPFEKPAPPLPDLSLHNQDLRHYVEAIHQLALKRGCGFVDLFTPLLKPAGTGLPQTDDGVHLRASGHWSVARETSDQLGFRNNIRGLQANPATGALQPDSAERLRQLIQAKNRLWFDYWRPMNWAFLKGDRTEQPSSRDHRNPKIRWFPTEMEQFPKLIEAKEQQIARLAAEVMK